MIPSHVRIFLCVEPQDMRCGFERLALAARRATGVDPRDGGALFCFVNKRRNRLKILWKDATGWCLLYKRTHGALFEVSQREDVTHLRVDRAGLATLLRGVPSSRRRRR